MEGTLALVGGGEFSAVNEALDRRLLAAAYPVGSSEPPEVVIVVAADAFERPERLVEQATAWFAGLGATVTALPVLRRPDALDRDRSAMLATARFVYLAGDSQLHLRSVLKETPAWDAIEGVLRRGGVVAASGPSASAVCDPMLDSRGGGITLGLGLAQRMVFVPRADTLSAEWLKRTRDLARGTTVVEAAMGAAAVRTQAGWELIGAVTVHGSLGEP